MIENQIESLRNLLKLIRMMEDAGLEDEKIIELIEGLTRVGKQHLWLVK